MRRDRDRLDTLIVKEKFGFLFNGFKRKFYYWEIAIMYRKVLMIFIAVFLNRIGVIVQALVILIVLVSFIQINNLKRPFSDRSLNEIENISLLTSTVTIYCGIFFLSAGDPTSQSFDSNTDFKMTATGSIILFLMIVGFNILFMVIWAIKFYFIVREMVRDKYPKLYIYFFLCCRKDRWVRENVQRAKNQKNEYMIAKIEDIQYFMKDMKSMYINHINYEGHEDFMKLLYIIEGMKPRIDMTIKKNDFKIDGKIARERRFDPDHLKMILDEKKVGQKGPDYFEQSKSQESQGVSSRVGRTKNKSLSQQEDEDFYLPKSKEGLLDLFGDRKKIREINNRFMEEYDKIGNESEDFAPQQDPEEIKKKEQLEEDLLKRLQFNVEKAYNKKATQDVFDESADIKPSKNTINKTPEASVEEELNTTGNHLIKDKQQSRIENTFELQDNEMNKLKASRNAKALMPKSKEELTGFRKTYKIDPKFNLPRGETIIETTGKKKDLKVEDYDPEAEVDSATKLASLKSQFSELGIGAKHKIHDDSSIKKAQDSEEFDITGGKIVKEAHSHTGKAPRKALKPKRQLSTHEEKSNESDSSKGSPDEPTHDAKPKPNLVKYNLGKGILNKIMIPTLKARRDSKSISEEIIPIGKGKRKQRSNLEDLKVSVKHSEFRKSFLEKDKHKDKAVEPEELEIDLEECLESIEP